MDENWDSYDGEDMGLDDAQLFEMLQRNQGIEGKRPRQLSDGEIQQNIDEILDNDWMLSLRDLKSVNIKVSGGIVTLSGEVSNRFAKFWLYSLVYWEDGVKDALNNITIMEPKRGRQKQGAKELQTANDAGKK